MVAMVSMFSGACDHIWSAGPFMLVVLVSFKRNARRASNRAGRNDAVVLLRTLQS